MTKPAWLQRPTSVRPIAPRWAAVVVEEPLPPPPPAPIIEELVLDGMDAPPPSSSVRRSVAPPPIALETATIALREELRLAHEENARLHAELAELTAAMTHLRARILEDAEPELVRLAVAIAERAVGAATHVPAETILAWAREALASLPAQNDAVLAVSSGTTLAEGEHHGVRVVVDASLPAGQCELRAGAGIVALTPTSRLRAIADELGVEAA